MAQQGEVPAIKSDNLSSNPRTHRAENTNSHKLFSDRSHSKSSLMNDVSLTNGHLGCPTLVVNKGIRISNVITGHFSLVFLFKIYLSV